MNKQANLSSIQLAILIMGFLLGSTIIIVPGSYAKQDAWLAYIMAWIGGILLFSCYFVLYKRAGSRTLVEINRMLLGRWLGNLVSVLYIWYFIHLAALVLRNFGEYTITAILPSTPLWFIMVCYVLVTGYSVRSGIEVTARTAELIVPFIFLFQLAIFAVLIPYYDFTNVKPILAEGIKPVLKAGLSVLTFPFGESIVLLMFLPYLHHSRSIKKTYIISFLIAGGVLLLGIFRDLAIMGAGEIGRTLFPPHYTIQRIPGLNIDSLLGVFFFMSGSTKICCCYLAATIGLSQITNSRDHRPFVIPIGMILTGLSLWVYDSAPEMLAWAIEVWPYYSLPFQIFIPLLLLILSFIKGKKMA